MGSRRRAARMSVKLRGPSDIRSKGRKILLFSAVTLLLFSAAMGINYLIQGNAARNLQKELKAQAALPGEAHPSPQSAQAQTAALSFTAAAPGTPAPAPIAGIAAESPMLPEFLSLFSRNRDMVGWLSSDAIAEIDFPVVQRDNTYYLDKDFYGRGSLAGTVFMDEGNVLMPLDQNLILHGHNMKNGTMFGKLSRLTNKETLLADPFFRFSTLYAGSLYVPYAVSLISVDPAAPNHFDFSAPRFENEKALALYVQGLKNASLFSFPVDVTGSDLLLTLATCYGNDADARLIVALRAMRARESRQIVLQELRGKTRAR